MAIANDNQATFAAVDIGSDPYSWSHTINSATDGILVVMVGAISSATAPTSVTVNDGGGAEDITANLIDSWTPGPRPGVWVYYYLPSTTGNHDIEVQFSAAYQGFGISTSFTGVDQTTPIGNTNDFGDYFGNAPSTTVSSATGERVVDVIAVDDGDDHTTPPSDDEGQALATVLGSAGGGSASIYGASSWEAGAASVTCSWSLFTGDSVAGVAFALQEASGGDTTVPEVSLGGTRGRPFVASVNGQGSLVTLSK